MAHYCPIIGCFIIYVTISALYICQNTFKWKSLSIRRYNKVLFDTLTSAGLLKMLNSITLHRKGAVFKNDNITSPLLQNDIQTVIDYSVARVCLKIHYLQK